MCVEGRKNEDIGGTGLTDALNHLPPILQSVCNCCSKEKKLFEFDKTGRRGRDRFCHKCIAKVAAQRGSKIYWDGVFEEVEAQPPYLAHMFQHFSSSQSVTLSNTAASSVGSAGFSDTHFGSSAAYIRDSVSSFARADMESTHSFTSSYGGRGESDYYLDDAGRRRRQSHVDRLSTSSYSKEQLLNDLFS